MNSGFAVRTHPSHCLKAVESRHEILRLVAVALRPAATGATLRRTRGSHPRRIEAAAGRRILRFSAATPCRRRRTRFAPTGSHGGSHLTDAPKSAGLVALADRIELWPIDHLRPYERNPRTHSEAQVDQIAASMVEFGWTNPILVDENAGHPRRPRPAARRAQARAGRGAGDPVRAPERGAEAGLPDRRQPARPAGGVERGAAGRGAGVAAGRALRPRPGRLRCHRARAAAGAGGRRGGVRRGRGRGSRAARGAGQQAGRPLGPRQPPPAVRRRHGAGRRRAGARRTARGHDLLRPAIQCRLRQLAEGQAAGQAPADPERRSRRRLRGVPAWTPASTSSA